MNHKDILSLANHHLSSRVAEFGPEEACFDRISKLATIILNKEVSPYDVAMIMLASNLGQLQEARTKPETYVLAITNVAFGLQFASSLRSVGIAIEEDIVGLAKRAVKNNDDELLEALNRPLEVNQSFVDTVDLLNKVEAAEMAKKLKPSVKIDIAGGKPTVEGK